MTIQPGEKHHQLTFLCETTPQKRNTGGVRRMIAVACDCGNTKIVRLEEWKNDRVKSCGCIERSRHHGMTKTGIYGSWKAMKTRCTPAFWERYPTYTGVKCDPRWETFQGFLANQPEGRPHKNGLHLARFGDTGDYSPENCRWLTPEENNREMVERRARKLPSGELAIDVAKRNGVGHRWAARHRRGAPIEEAVKPPPPPPPPPTPEEIAQKKYDELVAIFESMEWGEWRR